MISICLRFVSFCPHLRCDMGARFVLINVALLELSRRGLYRIKDQFALNGAIKPFSFWFSPEVLNNTLFSNCDKLSFFNCYHYSILDSWWLCLPLSPLNLTEVRKTWWMKGICFIWFRGRHFSPSMPAWSSRADRYLKLLNSRYKRSGGRNLGDIRDGTPLSRHVKRYCLLVPFFSFCPVRRIPLCACVAFPFLLWRTIGKGSGGSNKKHPRVYSAFTLRGENHSQGAVTESAWVAATSNEPQTKINLDSIKTSCGVLVSNFNVGV